MAVVPPPGGNVDTRLFTVAWNISYVADKFLHIGNSIKDVFIIGSWLSTPFLSVGTLLWSVASKLISSGNVIGDWLNWIRYIIDGNGFINLLRWASWHYEQIRLNVGNWLKLVLPLVQWWFGLFVNNPKEWLNYFIRQLSWVMGLFIDNPYELINHLLRGLRGWLGQFLDNPRDYIIGLLSQIMPELWSFLINPYTYILTKLAQGIFDFNGFRFSPGNWIIYRLTEVNGALWELLREPELFVKRRVGRMLGLPDYAWDNPLFFLINSLLEKLRQYRNHFADLIKETAIDFILLFM